MTEKIMECHLKWYEQICKIRSSPCNYKMYWRVAAQGTRRMRSVKASNEVVRNGRMDL